VTWGRNPQFALMPPNAKLLCFLRFAASTAPCCQPRTRTWRTPRIRTAACVVLDVAMEVLVLWAPVASSQPETNSMIVGWRQRDARPPSPRQDVSLRSPTYSRSDLWSAPWSAVWSAHWSAVWSALWSVLWLALWLVLWSALWSALFSSCCLVTLGVSSTSDQSTIQCFDAVS